MVGFNPLVPNNNLKIKNLDPRFKDISLIEESPDSKEETKTNLNNIEKDHSKSNIPDIYSPEYGYDH